MLDGLLSSFFGLLGGFLLTFHAWKLFLLASLGLFGVVSYAVSRPGLSPLTRRMLLVMGFFLSLALFACGLFIGLMR